MPAERIERAGQEEQSGWLSEEVANSPKQQETEGEMS